MDKTFTPCEDCHYSYSKNNQDMGMCEICELTYFANETKKLTKELETNKQEWISVDERLPENDWGKHWKDRNYYLVYLKPSGLMSVVKYGYKEYDWWIDSHDCVLDKSNWNEVTHYMPLPKPPQVKGEQK